MSYPFGRDEYTMRLSRNTLLMYVAIVISLALYGTVAITLAQSGIRAPSVFEIPYLLPGAVLLETFSPQTSVTAVPILVLGLLTYFTVLFAPLLLISSGAKRGLIFAAVTVEAALLIGHCLVGMAIIGGGAV